MNNWYRKILEVWKQGKPPPQTTEEVYRLVTEILKRNPNENVEGLLSFYGLPPLPHTQPVELSPPESPVSLPVIESRPLDSRRGLDTPEELQGPLYLLNFDKAMECSVEMADFSVEKMPSNPLRHESLIKIPEETRAMLKLISGDISDSQLDPILEVKNPNTQPVELSPPESPVNLPEGVLSPHIQPVELSPPESPVTLPEGVLSPHIQPVELSPPEAPVTLPEGVLSPHIQPVELSPPEAPVSLPEGVRYQFQTLPVRITTSNETRFGNHADQACVILDNKVDPIAVSDGDTITVYVSTSEPAVSSSVPKNVNRLYIERAEARKKGNYPKADELLEKITDSGYKVLTIEGEEVLARKFRIRLR